VPNTSHPVEPPAEWEPTWDDSLRQPTKRIGLLDPTEGGIAVSKPGDEKDTVTVEVAIDKNVAKAGTTDLIVQGTSGDIKAEAKVKFTLK